MTQTPDPIGRLYQIADAANTYLTNLSYNAAGQTTGFTYGNGVVANFTYNDHLQVDTLKYSLNNTPFLDLRYGYSAANNGQIRSVDEYVNNVRNDAKSITYDYDVWGRLKIAQTRNLAAANTYKSEWGYDRLGNRLSQSITGGTAAVTAPTLTVDQNTNRITTTGFAYDAAGNTTNDSSRTFAYDAENRIKSLNGGGTYLYDGNGLRTQYGNTVYIYSGSKVIAEYSGGSLQMEYIYAGSKLVATIASGAVTYAHSDHLSTRVETNGSGGQIRTYGHLPFGETWYETGTPRRWKFTTYERDNDANPLDYAMARYSSPKIGRFISADVFGGSGAIPQSLNRYAYVNNDPINLVDPSGHECWNYWLVQWDKDHFLIETSTFLGMWCEPDVAGVDTSGGGDQGGEITASNTKPADQKLKDSFAALLRALAQDEDCIKYLSKAGINPIEVGNAVLEANTLGQGEIQVGSDKYSVDATTPSPDGKYATLVNTNGGYFHDNSSVGVPAGFRRILNPGMKKEIRGGTPAAQTFILLHELGHLTTVNAKDKGNMDAQIANNKALEENCAKTPGIKKK